MGITRILLLATTLAAGGMALHVAFDDDEFQHLHMAWLIARGEVPHRDFFEHHVPLYHMLLAPATLGNAGPGRILAARGVSVLMLTATVGLMAVFLKRRLGTAPPAVLAWCAFSPIFFIKMLEVRPEVLCMLLIAGVLVLLSGAPPRMAIAGVLTGAIVCTSQKFIFPAIGLTLMVGLDHPRRLPRFLLGGAVLPLLLLAYYGFTGALPLAWEHLVIMNAGWKESFSPAMYGNLLWTSSGLLVIFGCGGMVMAEQRQDRRDTAILLMAGLAAVLLVPIPFRQTWLMLYPGLVLGSALSWQRLARLWPTPRPARLAGWTLALAALLPAAGEILRESRETLDADYTLMQAVERETTGPVFDGRGLVFWRRHVGTYAWLHEGLMQMLDPDHYTTSTIAAIRAAGFPDILLDYRIAYMPDALQDFLIRTTVPREPYPLRVPGVRVDRSRLGGSGTRIELPVAGRYAVHWRGGSVMLNGQTIQPGQQLNLGTGPHAVQAQGFVRELELYRVGSAPP